MSIEWASHVDKSEDPESMTGRPQCMKLLKRRLRMARESAWARSSTPL